MYNALPDHAAPQLTHGLTLQAAYTWSHALDNSTSTYSETDGSVNDYIPQSLVRPRASETVPRSCSSTTFTPCRSSRTPPTLLPGRRFGGWQISGIGSFFTGDPLTSTAASRGYNSGIGGAVRCNTVGKVQIKKRYLQRPHLRTHGNLVGLRPTSRSRCSANSLPTASPECSATWVATCSPVLAGTTLTWRWKRTSACPGSGANIPRMQFRLETFNTFNHVQWNGFNYGCSSNNSFGEACNNNTNTPGEVSSDWGPRNLQLGLKFIF